MTVTPIDPPCELCGKFKSEHLRWTTVVDTFLVCRMAGRPGDDGYPKFRRRKVDMPRLGVAPHPAIPLGSYIHVKSGGRYEVIGGTFDATPSHDAVKVLYQSVPHGYLADRDPEDFAAKFRRYVPEPEAEP